MPSALATTGAVFGVSSSGVIVASRTRSTSVALRPASSSARRAALTARSAVRSSGAAKRRSRMPVRRVIQSESTPIRSAIGPFGTTWSGSLWPRAITRAVRGGATRPLSGLTDSWVKGSGMKGVGVLGGGRGGSGCRRGVVLRRGLHLRSRDDPLGEPRQHLAGANLDEALGARVVQRREGLAPADRADQRARELVADVLERLGRRAREHGEARLRQLDLVERRAERRDGRSHRRRVERAGDREPDRALAELAGDRLRAVE